MFIGMFYETNAGGALSLVDETTLSFNLIRVNGIIEMNEKNNITIGIP
jgi:hypothetical protein